MPTPASEPVMSGAALVVVIIWGAKLLGVDLSPEVATALSVLILALGGWVRSLVTPVQK